MARIVAVLACHNRKPLSLRCLESFFGQEGGFDLSAVVYDDGSTDGTAEALLDAHGSRVRLIQGDGSAFWNRGMSRAFDVAMQGDADFFLWLNDDVILAADAVPKMMKVFETRRTPGDLLIVVGPLTNPDSGEALYGALRQEPGPHMSLYLQPPDGEPAECASFHGNCVLIPRAVAERVGTIAPHFFHNYGDLDYGLRARRAGCVNLALGEPVGVCASNDRREASERAFTHGTLRERWSVALDRKIIHIPSRIRFFYRHAGVPGLFYAIGCLRRLLPFRGFMRAS